MCVARPPHGYKYPDAGQNVSGNNTGAISTSRADTETNGAGLPLWALAVGGVVAVLVAGACVGMLRERRVPDPGTAPDELSSHPRVGDILLFYRPRRGRDYIIRWFTHSPFYHAAFYAGADTVLEARPAGVHRNSLAGRTRDYLVVPAPGGKGEAALAWATTRIGDPYDVAVGVIIGLEHLFTRWHINYTPPGKYSCSELIADAFGHVGFDPFPGLKPYETAPGDWATYLPAPFDREYTTS